MIAAMRFVVQDRERERSEKVREKERDGGRIKDQNINTLVNIEGHLAVPIHAPAYVTHTYPLSLSYYFLFLSHTLTDACTFFRSISVYARREKERERDRNNVKDALHLKKSYTKRNVSCSPPTYELHFINSLLIHTL